MKHISTFILLLFSYAAWAQPLNDSCVNANVIAVADNGWGLGTFSGIIVPLNAASREIGESFDPLLINAGMDRKSVWYKFSVATSRQVTVQLRQRDTMIAQNAVGFAVYYTGTTKPLPNIGSLSKRLPTISKFGSSQAVCLQPGEYLIQVCARYNVTDSIWIDLTVAASNVSPYDNKANAYNFGVVQGTNQYVNFSAGCLSVEDTSELFPFPNNRKNEYTQSAWVVMKTDNDVQSILFHLQLTGGNNFRNVDSLFWGVRIFKGNVKTENVAFLDSMMIRVGNGFAYNVRAFIRKPCEAEPDTYYSMQFVFHTLDEYNLRLYIEESGGPPGQAAYPPALPAAYKLGVLQNNVQKTTIDYLSCNTKTSLNVCGNNVPSLLVDSTMQIAWNSTGLKYDTIYTRDTFDLNTWLTFEVPQKARIDYGFLVNYCGGLSTGFLPQIKARLFAGDVTTGCNLPFIKKIVTSTDCIEAGKYSIQIIARSYTPNNTNCIYNMVGARVTTSLKIYTSLVSQPAATNNKPSTADDLGDITALLKSGGTKTTANYYIGNTPDTITLSGIKMQGYMLFTQFYLSEPMRIRIDRIIPSGTTELNSFYLMKGKVAIDSLINLRNFTTSGSNRYYESDYCFPLGAGWYTIVAYKTSITRCESNIYATTFTIKKINLTEPTPRYNLPSKAFVFNNGLPMEWTANTGTPDYPKTRNVYATPQHFFGCSPDTPFVMNVCNLSNYGINTLPLYVNYYVVKIKNNGTLLKFRTRQEEDISWYSVFPNQYLIKGDVRANASILTDTTLRIASCASGITYCNLDSGTYTLALFIPGYSAYNLYAVVDKMYATAFDHFIDASDMGLIPANNSEYKSQPDFFSCYTSASTLTSSFYNNTTPSIQPNYLHDDYRVLKDVWYTFAVAGSGTIDVKSYSYPYPNAYNATNLWLYQSNETTGLSFVQLKTLNRVDSSSLANVAFSGYYQNVSVTYSKPGCDTTRYYVRIQNYQPFRENCQTNIGVTYNASNASPLGDVCSSAIPFSLSAAGNVNASAVVNCHSIGEGFGEDGSNMGCLGSTTQVKTTWFKFTYSGTQKVDLTFQLQNNTNITGTQIAYRVLYGNCNSMTAGPCVGSGLSSFKLDCMASGDYYIQVATPLNATGTITMNAVATATTYPICKPFNLSAPFAYFYPSGGCGSGEIKFTNLSSQGDNIVYHWDFDNGTTSVDKLPTVTYLQQHSVDTFMVKLVITDTILDNKDSIIIPVFVYYNSLWVDAGNDTAVACGQTYIELKAATNFSAPVYEWEPVYLLDNQFIENPKVLLAGNYLFKVKMTAENCVLNDSVSMKIVTNGHIQGDTVLTCNSDTVTLTAPSGYSNYYWSTGQTGNPITVSQTGKYWVQLYNGSCQAYDTIEVTGDNPIVNFSLGNDTIVCAGETLILQVPQLGYQTLWSTTDTTQHISVNNTGTYWVKVTSGTCEVYDTILIEKNELSVELGTDKNICEGDSVRISPQVNGIAATYQWSTNSSDTFLVVSSAGLYSLKVSNENCQSSDTILVNVKSLPDVKLPDDTTLCGDVGIALAANSTFEKYLWSTGDTLQSVFVNNSGVYWLKGFMNDCSFSDTINIKKVPLPIVNVGSDTTFCGNFLFQLEANNGIAWQWLPTGEQTKQIYVHQYGLYTIIILDSNGCTASDSMLISEKCENPIVFVPNAFTPDKNNLNDYFKAVVRNIVTFEMMIYDRWGALIFYTDDINKGWDGTYKGEPMPPDVYTWIIHAKGQAKGSKFDEHGTVTLLR